MFNLIHTSSHLQSQGSCCLQDCRKGRHHHPVLPCGSWKHNVGQIVSAAAARGDQTPAKFLPALSNFFFSLPWLSCSAASTTTAASPPPSPQGRETGCSPSAATTYLAAGRRAGDSWALLPSPALTTRKRIQQQHLQQAIASLGWQLGYRFFYSRYLVSPGFSAKIKKDKKCEEAFASS